MSVLWCLQSSSSVYDPEGYILEKKDVISDYTGIEVDMFQTVVALKMGEK
jgi:hypothetical protein